MSIGSISGEKVVELWKIPDGFTSNDEWLSDASEIRSELSSNAGDLWFNDLTFAPNYDFDIAENNWKPGHMKRGPWTDDEDQRLTAYIQSQDKVSWLSVPDAAGISRSSQSCRLRWNSYLKKTVKGGDFTRFETVMIDKLHRMLGDRWADIAARIPGRTENEVKNYWNSHIQKRNGSSSHQEISAESTYVEKLHNFRKICDGFASNDEWSSDVSEILSELSSNAGDLWSDDLTFEPNDDFVLAENNGKDLSSDFATFKFCDYALDHLRDQFTGDMDCEEVALWLSNFIDEETRGIDVGHSNDAMIPFPAHIKSNGSLSGTTLNNNLGQSNVNATPPLPLRAPQVDYLYETNIITFNDSTDDDDNDDQNNGEICISLDVIKQHLHMNMDDAVERLKVSRSTLKRICRKYGIKRWPYRKRRKVNDKGHSSSVTVKATYKDDIIKFRLPVTSRLNDLMEKVAERLNLEIQTFKLKYMDDDCDLVLIACDEDLKETFDRLLRPVDYTHTLEILVFPVSNDH